MEKSRVYAIKWKMIKTGFVVVTTDAHAGCVL